MRLNVEDRTGSTDTATYEMLRIMAELCSEPDRAISNLAQLLQELTGARSVVVVLFNAVPVRAIVAGQETRLDVSTIKNAASSLPSRTPCVVTLGGEANATLLAPVYRGDALRGAVCLFVNTSFSPDAEVLELLQSAAYGAAVMDRELELAALAASAEQFAASVITAISDPLIALDAQYRVVSLNPAAQQLFNVKRSDFTGEPLDTGVLLQELRKLINRSVEDNNAEWTATDGRVFMPYVQVVRGDTDDRGMAGWVVVLKDITHFKRLIRNQSEFTRVVSHDLRSPMTSMQGFASMLGMVGDLTDRQKHFVEKILSGIAQMTALVDNIQDAGRYDPETGFYELSRTPCDIGELVTRIANQHLVPAEKQELTLTTDIAPDVPILNVDAHMLERAVTNLIDNAIKYTPNGGKVCIGVARNGGNVIISVRDNGLGISPENQKLLFERHFRIAREEHRRVKGSGLGLFIVRSVAQRHGGQAWVESAEGQGSTFFISIPIDGNNLANTNG
ncbi:MAG: sensor histidine kinase [Aggregatilineales bacterium]